MTQFLLEHGNMLIVVCALLGLLMACGIGANDVANAMGTSVGSKVITIKQAIIIAMVFEFMGAYFAGGQVTSTIKNNIFDSTLIDPSILAIGMIAAVAGATTWLFIATAKGWPVSTTHTIVGALVGFAAFSTSYEAVKWNLLVPIALSWIVTPAISALIAYLIFMSALKLIIDTEDPFKNARKFIPLYMFITGFVVSFATVAKGLKNINLDITTTQTFIISSIIGFIIMIVGRFFLYKVNYDDSKGKFSSVEKAFAVLMLMTACAMAFSHGSNDVSNAIGPLAVIVSLVETGSVSAKTMVPSWVLFVGAIGIVVGLITYGYKVIATIGKGITELTPSKGFAAELAASITIISATFVGLPVSTTHTLVGSVIGVGLAKGVGALNLNSILKIASSWIITLPAGAIAAIFYYVMLKGLLM